LTAALAEAFYKGATTTLERHDLEHIMTGEEVDHWRNILTLSEKPTAREFAKALKAGGDSVMYRMWTHVKGDNYDLSE
jgi:preprotein translocase subunit Sss1